MRHLVPLTVLVAAGIVLVITTRQPDTVHPAPDRPTVARAAASPAVPPNPPVADRVATPADVEQIEAAEDRRREKLATDPIAAEVPMLMDRTPEHQLQTLRWMKTVPGTKLVSAFPDVRRRRELSMRERQQLATRRADELIARLETRVRQP